MTLLDTAGNRWAAPAITCAWTNQSATFPPESAMGGPLTGFRTRQYGPGYYTEFRSPVWANATPATGVLPATMGFLASQGFHVNARRFNGPVLPIGLHYDLFWEPLRTLEYFPLDIQTVYAPLGEGLQAQPLEGQGFRFTGSASYTNPSPLQVAGPAGTSYLRVEVEPKFTDTWTYHDVIVVPNSIWQYGAGYICTAGYSARRFDKAPTTDLSNWLSWSAVSLGPVRDVPPSWVTQRTVPAPEDVSRRVPVPCASVGPGPTSRHRSLAVRPLAAAASAAARAR